MQQALALAAKGRGDVEPNPMVGCVIVSDGEKIAEGFHRRFGQAHAEIDAIENAARAGQSHRLANATAYVTLEPCCHQGKTPPCTNSLIIAGIRRVVVAMEDPFEKVRGQGIAQLRANQIQVDVGLEEDAARILNAPYLKRLTHHVPWIIGKWAMSLDGRIATRTGDSQWISGASSRKVVHHLRGLVDAILVGSGTALADNPSLTARGDTPPRRTAIRIVADSRLRLPLDSMLAKTAKEVPVLLLAGPDATARQANQLRARGIEIFHSRQPNTNDRIVDLFRYLSSERSVTNVLVEGGAQILGSLLDAELLDQCEVFTAPMLIGGASAKSPLEGVGCEKLAGAVQLKLLSSELLDGDIHCSYIVERSR